MYNECMYCRRLGSNGEISASLIPITMPHNHGQLHKLPHIEGTDAHDCTSPTIGHGIPKMCRDLCMKGYAVGCTPEHPENPPSIIDYAHSHVLCYDIEAEYAGPAYCNHDSPILCISLVCSCGYRQSISRRDIRLSPVTCHVRSSNREMAELMLALLIDHKPIFTLGHNTYGYDNKVLALALGSGHTLSQYFKQVMRSDSSTVTDFGLMMVLPGINNLDTYRYIRQSMFGTYKAFSLDALCKANDIPSPKIGSDTRVFSEYWYMESSANAKSMLIYNLRDCTANLALCVKLDIINQVIALSYAARAWIEDVMLYNTGAMATSCLCSAAFTRGYEYNWTRCDWNPNDFKGGELMYFGPLVANNVMSMDFVSMYPSIMASAGISPESIDYITPDVVYTPRFSRIAVVFMATMMGGRLLISYVMYGVRTVRNDNACHQLIISECNMHASDINVAHSAVAYHAHVNLHMDPVLSSLGVQTVRRLDRCNQDITDKPILDRLIVVHDAFIASGIEHNWMWIPTYTCTSRYSIDWIVSSVGYTTIVRTPEYEAHFTHGSRIASTACRELMHARKIYKRKIRQVNDADPALSRSYDKVQYALKISANSMYGTLSFSQYNTFSPRCGMSVTAIGRWSLNVATAIVHSLGFDVIYGDTDSVMFCMHGDILEQSRNAPLTRVRPIQPYIDALRCSIKTHTNHAMCEYLCESGGSSVLCNESFLHLQGVVSRITNHIMSYTCMSELMIEHQPVGCTVRYNISSSVFRRMIVIAKKHYIALLYDMSTHSKGVSYVRRTGSLLKDEATRRFSTAILTQRDRRSMVRGIAAEYRALLGMILHGTNIEMFHISTSVRGVTDRYVKVIHPNIKYVRAVEFNRQIHRLDIDYYKNILIRAIETVGTTIGLQDASPIVSGMGIKVWGV